MRALLISVRTRGQEPWCSSATHLQEGGLPVEEERDEAVTPSLSLPTAPRPDLAAHHQHLSCNSLSTERLMETFWEPSKC